MRKNIDRSVEIKCVSPKYPLVQSDDSLKHSIISVERDFVSKYIQSVDSSDSTVLFPILKNTPNSLFYKVLDFYNECECARRNAVIYGDSFIYMIPNRGHCKVICL